MVTTHHPLQIAFNALKENQLVDKEWKVSLFTNEDRIRHGIKSFRKISIYTYAVNLKSLEHAVQY